MCNLETRKTHDTRNVRWMGKLFKDHVKEDAVSEEESSKSDSTKNKKKEDTEEETEEEQSDGMAEVTETVDSEQLVKEEKSEKSEESSEEAVEEEEVGMRTKRQRQEMGDDLRGGKRLRSQLREIIREAERGFMVTERACGAMVTDFEVKEIEVENTNMWRMKLEKN